MAKTHELIFDFAGPKYCGDNEMYTWWMVFDESTKVEQMLRNFQYVRSQNMVNIRVIVTRDLKYELNHVRRSGSSGGGLNPYT